MPTDLGKRPGGSEVLRSVGPHGSGCRLLKSDAERLDELHDSSTTTTRWKLASGGADYQNYPQVSRPEREHPRFAHEASVTLVLGKKSIEGSTRNVSRGGLCIDLAEKVKVGEDVDVDLVLVFDEETESEPLRMPSRIVWCTKLDDTFQVGIVFRPMEADRAEYLTMFLRYLDDGTGGKRVRTPPPASIDERFR